MRLEGATLSAARCEVEQLFGHCLLRLQSFELKLKGIVATHRFSGSIDTLEANQARRINETRRKTLGGLVGEMMGSVLAPAEPEGFPDEDDDEDEDAPETSFAFSQRIVFPAEEFLRIEAENRDLVVLRNFLVHNFLEEHDLSTEHGCFSARQVLTSAIERVSRANEDMLVWAKELERTRKAFADKLASPDVRAWIATGRIPWSATTIVQALLDATTELAPGDWTSVENAAALISARHPHERPQNYGCRTWRQVIHESGLFELQTCKTDGRRHARYRPRNPIAEVS